MSDSVSVSRNIKASADVLYELVSDLPRMGEWSPENTGGKWVKPATGPAVGARFRGTNRHGWRRWSTEAVVTVAGPGREFSFDVSVGPMKVANWRYTLRQQTDGTTEVTEMWTDQRARWAAAVSGIAAGVRNRADHNRAGMEATLAALARTAESAS
jgi:hypothetical protein